MNETPHTPPIAPLPPPQPPVQPPTQPPVLPPSHQPSASNTPASHNQTDVLGIISIVMVFIALQPVGFVLGLIGASKAKREGYSPLLSRVGWIANLVTMICILFVIALIVLIALSENIATPSQSNSNDDSKLSRTTSDTRQDTVDGFSLTVPKDFEDLPAEYRNTAANYTQGSSATNEYALVIKESVSDFRSSMTVQDYADLINTDYKTGETIQNAVITPLTELSNPSMLDVVDYTMMGESSDLQIVYYIRYIKTATSFYQIMTWTSPSTVDTAKADLYSILESFREE